MVQLYNQRGMQGICRVQPDRSRLVDGSRVLVEIRYDVT